MHLLILFLISVTAYAASRISNRFPRFQAANFGQMMDGKQLNGSVIKEIKVESESSCRLECVNEERCKSYNFGGRQRRNLRDGSARSVTRIDLRDQLGPTSSRTKSSVTEG